MAISSKNPTEFSRRPNPRYTGAYLPFIHSHLTLLSASTPSRRSRSLTLQQQYTPTLIPPLTHTSSELDPPQLNALNLSLLQMSSPSQSHLRRTYQPPSVLLPEVESYQMDRFLGEIPDFWRSVGVGESCGKGTVRRRRRYREELKRRVRGLVERIGGL